MSEFYDRLNALLKKIPGFDGHGTIVGECGHVLQRCRCPKNHSRTVVDMLCEDCEQAEVAKEASLTDAKVLQLHRARETTNTNPTPAQKEHGNYRKGKVTLRGFRIAIENPIGSVREGVSPRGKKWRSVMHRDYGYFVGSSAIDGDAVDVFIGEDPENDPIWVVDQVDGKGDFDEPKVILGAPDEEAARKLYLAHYPEGWKGLGAITKMKDEDFKAWLASPPCGAVAAENNKAAEDKAWYDHVADGLNYFAAPFINSLERMGNMGRPVRRGKPLEALQLPPPVAPAPPPVAPSTPEPEKPAGPAAPNPPVTSPNLKASSLTGDAGEIDRLREDWSNGGKTGLRDQWQQGGGLRGRVNDFAKNFVADPGKYVGRVTSAIASPVTGVMRLQGSVYNAAGNAAMDAPGYLQQLWTGKPQARRSQAYQGITNPTLLRPDAGTLQGKLYNFADRYIAGGEMNQLTSSLSGIGAKALRIDTSASQGTEDPWKRSSVDFAGYLAPAPAPDYRPLSRMESIQRNIRDVGQVAGDYSLYGPKLGSALLSWLVQNNIHATRKAFENPTAVPSALASAVRDPRQVLQHLQRTRMFADPRPRNSGGNVILDTLKNYWDQGPAALYDDVAMHGKNFIRALSGKS